MRPQWQTEAVCKGSGDWCLTGTSAYHRGRSRAATEAALKCAICPVLDECLQWAMSQNPDPCPFHVVAGLYPTERNRLRRQIGMYRRRR